MSKNRMVNTSFWSDPWVVDQLNPHDRYLFLYLFTNSHVNLAGVYEVSLRTIAYETGIDKEELIRMLKRLEPKVRYIEGWVILKNSIKNQNYHSPKAQSNIEFILQSCPPELMEYIEWPKDYGKSKPDGTMQTNLLADVDTFDGSNKRSKTRPKDVVESYNTPVSKATTPVPVKYPMHTVSPYKYNNKHNNNAAVAAPAAGSKIDRELAAKEHAAKSRKPNGSGYASASEIAKQIKRRNEK